MVPVAIHGSAGVRGWKKLRFPKVTVQYGEPLAFDAWRSRPASSSSRPRRRSSSHVARCTTSSTRKGRRGVIKALREGIGNPAEQKVPAEQSR